TTAEGAIVTTDDAAMAKAMKLWKFHGVERDAWKAYAGASKPATTYDVVLPGFKYNLTDLHAALGVHQLAKLPAFNKRRAEIAARFMEGLAGTPGLTLPGLAKYDHTHPWHLFVVLVPKGTRPAFIEKMNALGVGTGIHFEAVHTSTFYREKFGGAEGQCPVAEDVCSRCVSLPIYPNMTDADAERTVKAVKEAVGGARG
ncbi:MAG TPA: DegT/DnrJ/EryC1/StrS family aminotransferase, partial [Planctomycetota bacterium]|nr:DegT/DnrJ/EryC1/StrS family aminotransferase [Planctomycetota bacterium]